VNVTPLPVTPIADGAHTASRVCGMAGITYRQLDYWTRTGRVTASRHATEGHGDRRLYSTDDVLRIVVLARLLDAGLTLAAADKHLDAVLNAGAQAVPLGADVALTVDVDRLRRALSDGRRVAS
jgi:DNA-binding transcriptional MerR regulator